MLEFKEFCKLKTKDAPPYIDDVLGMILTKDHRLILTNKGERNLGNLEVGDMDLSVKRFTDFDDGKNLSVSLKEASRFIGNDFIRCIFEIKICDYYSKNEYGYLKNEKLDQIGVLGNTIFDEYSRAIQIAWPEHDLVEKLNIRTRLFDFRSSN